MIKYSNQENLENFEYFEFRYLLHLLSLAGCQKSKRLPQLGSHFQCPAKLEQDLPIIKFYISVYKKDFKEFF